MSDVRDDAREPASPGRSDVAASYESARRRRLGRIALLLGPVAVYLWVRILTGRPVDLFQVPHIDWLVLSPILFFLMLVVLLVGTTFGAGRSPHVRYRPEQLDVTFDDVVGIEPVKEDAVRSLELFLAHKTFAREMGGTARRGLLFEGQPGTGKTYLAKAMARSAGVPFLFVSATSFQSMYYGATARKIRSYFKALRKAARQEGGAIGFIEEIDAIATARGGLSSASAPAHAVTGLPGSMRHGMLLDCGGLSGLPSRYAPGTAGSGGWGSSGATVLPASGLGAGPGGLIRSASVVSEGVGGVVNELLVQMQSFDEPTGVQKVQARVVDGLNLLLPAQRQLRRPAPPAANVLLIAATNRADSLDPALLRPGRFDRRLSFELPDRRGRRLLLDAFLATKAHAPELDDPERRDALAGALQGYSPVRISHLLDEALINALRRGDKAMSWSDVERARLTEDVGMGQPVAYTEHEKRLIATHEAGHATVAWLVAPHRRLEVLTIVKRREALGLLAHGDPEEVFTRSRAELTALIQIAMGGQSAEEIFFGDVSTGPGGDLFYATNVAAEMIGSAGMGESLLSYAAIQNSAYSDTNLVGRVLADPEGRRRVETLLQEQKRFVVDLLGRNRHLVEALRDALLDRHELIGDEIGRVLRDAAPGAGHETGSAEAVAADPAAGRAAEAVVRLPDPVSLPE